MATNSSSIYDKIASKWWDHNQSIFFLNALNPHRFTYFDQIVFNWDKKKILDVGCGGGFTSEFLAKRGAIVTGVDQSKKLVEVASQHSKCQGLNIEYLHADARNLPLEDRSFDIIICVDTLEHIQNYHKVLSEIYRLLRPSGYFLFDTINKTFLARFVMIWVMEYLLRKIPVGVHDWQLFIPPEDLKKALEKTGFIPVYLKGLWISPIGLLTKKLHSKITASMPVMYIGSTQKGKAVP